MYTMCILYELDLISCQGQQSMNIYRKSGGVASQQEAGAIEAIGLVLTILAGASII